MSDLRDLAPPPLSPSPWIRTFAAWAPAVPDDERSILAGYTAAAGRLDEILEDEGAEALGPIDFRAVENRPIFDDPELDAPRLVLLAEVRAIILRHPNPFPELRLVRWPWSRVPVTPPA